LFHLFVKISPMSFPIQQVQQKIESDDAIHWRKYFYILIDNLFLILSIAILVTSVGVAYALLATPVYQSNILIQVADPGLTGNLPVEGAAATEQKKPEAAPEIGVLRSRRVVSAAVDNTMLFLDVQPRYFPVVGAWIARRNKELSTPGLFGYGGFVWDEEQPEVTRFDVPKSLEGKEFTLIADDDGYYHLQYDELNLRGRVGEHARFDTDYGPIALDVTRLVAKSGAEFKLTRSSRLEAIEDLQAALKVTETSKQSGIISVSLEGADPKLTSAILSELANEYIRQNEERKSRDAEKLLASLNRQLPDLKRELERAEAQYNEVRNALGTIDLQEEAKTILQQSVSAQIRMSELKQRKEELLVRFQEENPAVESVTQQIRSLSRDMSAVEAKIRRLPSIEQDVLRLSRDVKVNTAVYTTVLSTAQQLRLLTASKGGFARLLDAPQVAERPVRPKRMMIVTLATLAGIGLGCLGAFFRKSFYGRVDDPMEISERLGLPVRATISHSERMAQAAARLSHGTSERTELLCRMPGDSAIECLRRFRTSLQIDMSESRNNIVVITGPTPGVGKSFVSANLAVVFAAIGKKVLLIDGDLRTGFLHRHFGLGRAGGLSEAISGRIAPEHLVHRNVIDNVDFVATGVLPPEPAELLARPELGDLLRSLSSAYDVVLVDTAPVLVASDASVVAAHAGVMFNVVRAGVSTVEEIEEAVNHLNAAGSSIAGIVFNDSRPRSGRYGYGYGYGTGYGRHRYAAEDK
jgi:tyrosine-protein kinase Etk/Wzc